MAEQLPEPDCWVSVTVPVDDELSSQLTVHDPPAGALCVSFLPASVKFATTVTGVFMAYGFGVTLAAVTTGFAFETVTVAELDEWKYSHSY